MQGLNGGPCARQGHVRVLVDDGDVAELAARAHLFAVEVDFRSVPPGFIGRGEGTRGLVVGGTQQVDHDGVGIRCAQVGRAEWQVQDGAQVLLELAGDGPIDGPVSGVVGAHGQLVDEDSLVRSLSDDEHLDGQDAGDAQLRGNAFSDAARFGRCLGSDTGRGSRDLGAHAVHLDGGGDGPGGNLARGGARQQGRHLTREGHQGLGQERAASPP